MYNSREDYEQKRLANNAERRAKALEDSKQNLAESDFNGDLTGTNKSNFKRLPKGYQSPTLENRERAAEIEKSVREEMVARQKAFNSNHKKDSVLRTDGLYDHGLSFNINSMTRAELKNLLDHYGDNLNPNDLSRVKNRLQELS